MTLAIIASHTWPASTTWDTNGNLSLEDFIPRMKDRHPENKLQILARTKKVSGGKLYPKNSKNLSDFSLLLVSSNKARVSDILVDDKEKTSRSNPKKDWMVVSHPNSVRMKPQVASLIFWYFADQCSMSSFLQNCSCNLV